MAYVSPASWTNDDGLNIDYGTNEAKKTAVAEYEFDGPERMVEVVIADASVYNATDEYVLSDKYVLPAGAVITRAQMGEVTTAFASSGAGTISIGTVDTDMSSNGDIDSIMALAAVAELVSEGTAAFDGTLVANHTALASEKLLTLSVDTAVYQAGAGTVRIFWVVPKKFSDTLVWAK